VIEKSKNMEISGKRDTNLQQIHDVEQNPAALDKENHQLKNYQQRRR